jgi:hypothetical protein
MNIYNVRDNLKKTIEGKEGYLNVLNATLKEELEQVERTVIATTAKFLEVNLNELKVILFDVEKCCEQHALMSWEINPERMGQ